MDLKRKDGAKTKDGMDLKRLAKFYAADRPPRKRLRTLLEFIKSPPGSAGESGNIAVAVQTLLSGASKDTSATAADHVNALQDFWADPANAAMLFTVLNDCVTELETYYSPHENAFRKLRKKPLEAEDWNEVFEGLEVLVRNNIVLIHEGWNNNGFTVLFTKLLKRDNHALIKKYAFRCLALYTDATRNLQQLATISTSPLSANAHGAAAVMLMSEIDLDGDNDDNARGTAVLPTAPRRKNMHLDLLRESVDFSPYGGGSIMLPDKFINEGVHVEGWMRPMPTQAEEPVDMLKFVMDLSLEREDPKIVANPRVNHETRGDRFVFWCELIMKFYMPLLYPKICIKHKLKDEKDTFGFFHHCPGSFQRVVARWIYKLRSKEEFMDVLWSRREFSEVVMETIRQRFAYRDMELVLDAIKFYSGICNGAQYAPEGMKSQMNESSRAMISHVSQLFHPSVILDDTKMLLHSIELLELISQRKLDDYTATYLRKFVVSTIDNCVVLREPNNLPVLSAMISVVLHVWMHAAIVMKATGAQVWIELTVAMRRWLVNPNDANVVGAELINCWKRELRFTSCLLMYVMDQGQSMLKITIEGAVILPHSVAAGGSGSSRDTKLLKDPGVKQGYIQSSASFLMNSVHNVNDATLLLDRVLHLLPPPTVAALLPYLHVSVFEGMLQLIELWIDSAICSQRSTPTVLHQISPSTIIALFGEWFLPACELENTDYQSSRCTAIIILCKLCSVRCANQMTRSHLTVLARVLFRGITSPSGRVVSTVLQKASAIFTLNLEGMNVLVPSFLYAIDQIIIQNIWGRAEKSKVKASDWNKELTAALDVVFSILSLPKRFPEQNFVSWQQKFQLLQNSGDMASMGDIMNEIPDINEDFHAILGRILVRISDLPFMDVVDIKKRALWGLYCLVVTNLKPDAGVEPVDRTHLTEWIIHLIDFCQAPDFSISMTALGILQDLSDFHQEINDLESSLIARIVMTLAVFAQQQVEEASIEVQSAIENLGSAALDSGGDKMSNASGSLQRTSGGNVGARRGSDNRPSRMDGNNNGESNDPFSKLKNKLKPAGSAALQVGPPSTPIPTSPAIQSPVRPKEHEIPALRLIVQKTSAIFECLRFWVMHRSEVLQDGDVRKILFSAIEAALVGSLPDGEWQKEVERARNLERRMSMPLLFLGLQMRASLYNETSHAWLKFFEETAVAAEGLLMHLLHHINGFPSPAGVDQMVSNCSELNECEDSSENGGASQDKNDSAGFSFVFMNSIVITVVGSLDSPCARFVARDMTGLFSWEIAPAVSPQSQANLLLEPADATETTTLQKRHSSVDRNAMTSKQAFNLHTPDAAVRIDFKQAPDAERDGSKTCHTCGGEKPRQKPTEPAPLPGLKLAVTQIPWEREEGILGNTLCPAKSTYVFHEDTVSTAAANGAASTDSNPASTAQNGKKKSSGSRSGEVEKMPGAGNKDERLERLEKIARLHEERNNVGAHAPPQAATPTPKKCECHSSKKSRSAAATSSDKPTTAVVGLFDMEEKEPNIGGLDNERCLLDLVLDSIPMVFRDGVGDTTDKTLLGGRYSMLRYNLMDLREETNPLLKDSADMPGFSFLQRLIHDEECYAQLKAFLTKEENVEGKELVDFCDAVKRYERSTIPSDRLGQASVIYWEFFTSDGAKTLTFPPHVAAEIQSKIQAAQVALRNRDQEEVPLAGSLFQGAMAHIEYSFENSGLLDKYVAALDQGTATTSNGSATTNGKDTLSTSVSGGSSIPPQLGLFDSFSIMELNARISYLALKNRNEDMQNSTITKPRSATNPDKLIDSMAAGLGTSRVGALDICRLFLSQTGLLPSPNGDASAKSYLKLLENSAKLERSLKHLDKSPVRETMKIGVIYVGKHQQTQQEILRNERGSPAYERFLKQLGWEVELEYHRGFVGGLDPNPKSLSNGKTTLYYANSHSEVIFHVVTKMPTKPSDPQQIDKKRHVGNDYVHVVWSDNVTHEYDPGTITSHFNDVQVVIYPFRKAQKGLFYVQIYSKEKVPLFGPLQSGMVVHQRDLAQLVRQTAMNANRVCRSQTMIYVRPYPTRKKLVDEIVERYAVEYKENQLLSMLFTNSSASSFASSGVLSGSTLGGNSVPVPE